MTQRLRHVNLRQGSTPLAPFTAASSAALSIHKLTAKFRCTTSMRQSVDHYSFHIHRPHSHFLLSGNQDNAPSETRLFHSPRDNPQSGSHAARWTDCMDVFTIYRYSHVYNAITNKCCMDQQKECSCSHTSCPPLPFFTSLFSAPTSVSQEATHTESGTFDSPPCRSRPRHWGSR